MFVEKLNKKPEGVYAIEEEKDIANGIWEGYLNHDNANHQSICIYTGAKLTGDRVENYFISTPSETPWKTHLKVFSNSEKIYIIYETTGDQVEADDINLVQNKIADTVKDLADYKATANADINGLKNKTTNLEDVKANTTYVDIELNKKYSKDQVFTKEEVLQKIQEIIGTAPEALDTLEELARALDNDPDFATNIINLLSTKVDKVEGKGLTDENYTLIEKNKLAGIEQGANKYIHPTNHNADMIVENLNKRFVSDTEKDTWNDANTKKHTHVNKSILDTITQVLIDSWNSAVEHISDGIRHITSAERSKWNGKAEISDIPTKVGQLENDKNYVTQSELGGAGYGDMMKSTYDTNNNGIVDKADSVPWSGIVDKPTTFTPSSHIHTVSNITGLQSTLNGMMKKGPLTWNDIRGV
uniref:Minor tail protein n=1 Tax=Siphoviridae sp. ctOb14 TaxID=2827862 RepID=A0A8S5SLX9_9CAUD|nr:MAG TPA: minor tail protein [Siphoviridae sp. ctOb14]